MKRLVLVSTICSALAAGSFGVLLLEDRRLAVPLPYSIPLATLSLVVVAPIVFALFEWARARRPIVVQLAPVAVVAAAAPPLPSVPRRRGAEGVVLLDSSTFPRGVRAA